MPKKKKITTHQLKHDAFVDGYHRLAERVIKRKESILRYTIRAGMAVVLLAGAYLGNSVLQSRAERSLSNALGIINADVGTTPSADPSRKHFATDEERYKAALDAFRPLATKWYYALSGHRDLARYYFAISQLHLDPAAGQTALEKIAESGSSANRMAKFSLAEHYGATGKYQEAEARYRNLAQDPGDLPKSPIQLALARTLNFEGKKSEAVELYVKLATDYRTEEDGRQAIEALASLDPAALDRVPPEPKLRPDTDRLAKYRKK